MNVINKRLQTFHIIVTTTNQVEIETSHFKIQLLKQKEKGQFNQHVNLLKPNNLNMLRWTQLAQIMLLTFFYLI